MKYILAIVVVLVGFIAQAQTMLKGVVQSNNTPVPFATIKVVGENMAAVADSAGLFVIKGLGNVTYKLKVEALGYTPTEVLVNPTTLTEKLFVVNLDAFNNPLNEVVISATLSEVSIANSPVLVESYSGKYFMRSQNPTIYDALQMVNGLQPTLNCAVCNTGDIHINGLEGANTMVTIDGMPIVSGLSTVYGMMGIPSSLLERVEVVKGPSSTLYGSDAVAGLINIITKNPNTAPRFSADLSSTSYGEMNADLGFAKRLNDKVSTLLGINYFNYTLPVDYNNDGFIDNALVNRLSVFNKWAFANKLGQLSNIAVRVIYEDRLGGENNYDPALHRGSNTVYGESIYTNRYEVLGNYRFPVKENINLQYSYNYHHQNSVYGTMFYFAGQHTGFTQLVWQKNLGANNKLVSGMAYRYIYYDDNSPATRGSGLDSLTNSPFITHQPAIFVQNEYTPTERISILGGVRLELNSAHGPIFAPRLNTKFDFGKNRALRLGIGNGFRVVNLFTEEHGAISGARELIIKEELLPERSWNANANYTHQFVFNKGFVTLDVGGFYTYFTNRIIPDYVTNPNAVIYTNLAGNAHSRGLTAGADMQFTSGLKIRLGATYMNVFTNQPNDAGELERVPQLFAPNWQGTFAIGYTIKKWGVTVDYTGQIYGPMYLPVLPNDFRPAQSPTYSLQSLQVSKKFKSDKWEVYAGVKNLLNFVPQNPLMRPNDPFDTQVAFDAQGNPTASPNNPNAYTFDTAYGFAPMFGRRAYLGLRVNLY